MRYTSLGKTGLKVSVVSFGGIPIRKVSTNEADRVINRAVDLGINFFDTARGYGDSEDKLGRTLHKKRASVYLATKTPSRARDAAAADIEESLRRLQTDYLDLIQLHGVSNQTNWELVMGPGGALEALKEAKEAGKVRHIGITTHSCEYAMKALESGEFETLMIPYNFIENEPAKEVLPLAKKLNVAFIDMKPFGGGNLSDPIICLKYVLQNGVTVTIPGMATIEEVEQNAAVADMDWNYTPDEEAKLKHQAEELGKVFCRRCDYCQPCSQGVPISQILSINMMLKRFGLDYVREELFEKLRQQADACVECRACETRCPYNLSIPELIKERIAYVEQALKGV